MLFLASCVLAKEVLENGAGLRTGREMGAGFGKENEDVTCD